MRVFYHFHNRHLHAVVTFNAVCLLTHFGVILGISAAMWVAHSCLNIVFQLLMGSGAVACVKPCAYTMVINEAPVSV